MILQHNLKKILFLRVFSTYHLSLANYKHLFVNTLSTPYDQTAKNTHTHHLSQSNLTTDHSTGEIQARHPLTSPHSSTHQIVGGSDPSISRKSDFSSIWNSVKTREMVSPGSARMVHLHSPLLPRPPAPPPPPVTGESPLGKSKLEMSPLEPLRVPPHVSSAVSHQRKEKKAGRGGWGKSRYTVSELFQSHYSKFTMGKKVA